MTTTEASNENEIKGTLRVWWIPQVPMNSFYVYVKTIKEAKLIIQVLADYDTFQFENKVKPDYSNVGGLQVYDGEEWIDWLCEECDDDIDDCVCKEAM